MLKVTARFLNLLPHSTTPHWIHWPPGTPPPWCCPRSLPAWVLVPSPILILIPSSLALPRLLLPALPPSPWTTSSQRPSDTLVLTEILEIRLHKNKVGGYAYNYANTLLPQIERVLERQLYEDSSDGMKGLARNVSNSLNEYKSTIHTKKRDVLVASRAAADCASTDNITVNPEIVNNSDMQDKANRQNVFRLSAIGVKEGTAEGITKIARMDITNPILRTTDNSKFISVDQYQIHQLFTTIK